MQEKINTSSINNDRGIYDDNGKCIGLKPNPLKHLINKNEPPGGDYRWELVGDTWVFNENSKIYGDLDFND
jgi:hypothetical protein